MTASPPLRVASAEFVKGAVQPADYPDDGLPQVAVVGRSNVGKSSLLNFLLGRKSLARTSATPGKTREINFFLVNRAFYLVDIPGFGYAKIGQAGKEKLEKTVEQYFNGSAQLCGVLYLLDIRLEHTKVDEEALEWLKGFDLPLLAVATKADKLARSKRLPALTRLAETYALSALPLAASALEKTGSEEIWSQLEILLRPDAR